jgi:hypothetical protein
VVVLAILVLLDYGSLCSFSLFLAGKHSKEVSEGESPLLMSLAERLGRALVFINFLGQICVVPPPFSQHVPHSLARCCLLIQPLLGTVEKLINDQCMIFTRQGCSPHLGPCMMAMLLSFCCV